MKNNRGTIKILVILALLFVLYRVMYGSGYLSPMPVTITSESDFDMNKYNDKIFGLNYSATCNPGSADKVRPDGSRQVLSSYYTPGLLPGGICDDQTTINKLMNYKLNPDNIPLGD